MPSNTGRSRKYAGLLGWLLIPAACLLAAVVQYYYGLLLSFVSSTLPEPRVLDPAEKASGYRALFASLRIGGWVVGIWVVVLVGLLLVGVLLSRLTVSAIERNRLSEESPVVAAE